MGQHVCMCAKTIQPPTLQGTGPVRRLLLDYSELPTVQVHDLVRDDYHGA